MLCVYVYQYILRIELSSEEKIDASIATIMRYRTGGDGGKSLSYSVLVPFLCIRFVIVGQALKLLLTFVKNVNDHPEEMK